MRIAVLISGGGSTLDNLIRRISDGRLRNIEIAGVVCSRRDVGGVEIAKRAGLPVTIVRRKDFESEEAFSGALTRAVGAFQPDWVVMGGFLCLWKIPPHYAGRVLNIHPALLPKFGGRGFFGRRVHEAVLAAEESESGCTVHLADNQYDHGPILAQRRVPVIAGDTPESLGARVMQAERDLYPAVLQEIADHGVSQRLAGA